METKEARTIVKREVEKKIGIKEGYGGDFLRVKTTEEKRKVCEKVQPMANLLVVNDFVSVLYPAYCYELGTENNLRVVDFCKELTIEVELLGAEEKSSLIILQEFFPQAVEICRQQYNQKITELYANIDIGGANNLGNYLYLKNVNSPMSHEAATANVLNYLLGHQYGINMELERSVIHRSIERSFVQVYARQNEAQTEREGPELLRVIRKIIREEALCAEDIQEIVDKAIRIMNSKKYPIDLGDLKILIDKAEALGVTCHGFSEQQLVRIMNQSFKAEKQNWYLAENWGRGSIYDWIEKYLKAIAIPCIEILFPDKEQKESLLKELAAGIDAYSQFEERIVGELIKQLGIKKDIIKVLSLTKEDKESLAYYVHGPTTLLRQGCKRELAEKTSGIQEIQKINVEYEQKRITEQQKLQEAIRFLSQKGK
ncbi:MAG: hypothetical protein KKF39_02695 [Nanoarchaeota archaeon]|nr:hypothetical protein [Nanoarchaeota archaeon]